MVPKVIEEELNCKVDEDNMRKKLVEAAQREAGRPWRPRAIAYSRWIIHITFRKINHCTAIDAVQTAQLAVAEVWGQQAFCMQRW